MSSPVTIITGNPTVTLLGEMRLHEAGVLEMAKWVQSHRPACVPAKGFSKLHDLLPHDGVEETEIWTHAHDSEGHDLGPIVKALDAREVTDNELLVEIAGRKCFDAATAVLTRRGWVKFPDLRTGEAVAVYNEEAGQVVFETPTDYITKTHAGAMYSAESRNFSIRVTDDHDMYVQKYVNGPWLFAPAREVAGKAYRMMRAAPYAGETEFQRPGWMRGGTLVQWATLLGHVISEGTFVDGEKYGTGSRTIIYQRAEKAGPILANLAALGLEPSIKADSRNGVLHMTLNNTELTTALIEVCGHGSSNKRIPGFVFTWPAGARAALLDALMWGDGTSVNGYRVYTTVSHQLASAVQTLIMLSGKPGTMSSIDANTEPSATSFAGNHRVYRVREGKCAASSLNEKVVHDAVQRTDPEKVYCVTVPSRILVLNRNDKIFFASNCYDSFAEKAGRKSNKDYIAHTQSGSVPHASIMYHAKMTFFLAGISRRVSHELIRNYVGSDRTEEGSPSQESTRFTHHYGWFIAPPRIVGNSVKEAEYQVEMQRNYDAYQHFISTEMAEYEIKYGKEPKGLDRKRIYEAASHILSHSCETSFIWTTNAVALAKMFKERGDESADLEFRRLVEVWRPMCEARWPNLFFKRG